MTTKPKFNFSKGKAFRAAAKQKALAELWKRGDHLETILDDTQKSMLDAYLAYDRFTNPMFVWLCSRRLGKSVACAAYADYFARSNPNARILYLSKTTDNLDEILDQAFGHVHATCPDALLPKHEKKKNKYSYASGAEIRFKGLDRTGPDAIRGVKADLVVLDEFCFMENLSNLINNVLMPMIIATGGRILMASTPPFTPGHESINLINRCRIDGAFMKKTIYDCPRWTEKQIEQFAKEAGGLESDTFRREYKCELITQRDRAIFPNCTETHMETVVQEWDKPTTYIPDHYISIDPGGRDLTAILFGYWDYEQASLVVEHEALLSDPSTTQINIEINRILKGPWKGIKPNKIIMDNNNTILIKDIRKLHKIQVVPTKKDNKEAQVNQTNIMFAANQIAIHPRCTNLIAQCRFGIWNKTRTSFDRTASLSHCDAVDALVYLVRNLDRSKNPIPEALMNSGTHTYHGNQEEEKTGLRSLGKIFRRRR